MPVGRSVRTAAAHPGKGASFSSVPGWGGVAAAGAGAARGCCGIHCSRGAVQSRLQWPVLPHL